MDIDWGDGDYGRTAEVLAPAAEVVVAELDDNALESARSAMRASGNLSKAEFRKLDKPLPEAEYNAVIVHTTDQLPPRRIAEKLGRTVAFQGRLCGVAARTAGSGWRTTRSGRPGAVSRIPSSTGTANTRSSNGTSQATSRSPASSITDQRRSPASPHGSTAARSSDSPPVDFTG